MEVFLEILIITFAVSLAQYLERQRETNHRSSDEKAFLIGLKSDLKEDVASMENDQLFYQSEMSSYLYLSNIGSKKNPEEDSIRFYSRNLRGTSWLRSNNARFEGLKSSGGLQVIENNKLLNEILSLYEGSLSNLVVISNDYNLVKTQLLENYLDEHVVIDNNNCSNYSDVFKMPVTKNYFLRLQFYIPSILQGYDRAIKQSKLIIAQIDALYAAGN